MTREEVLRAVRAALGRQAGPERSSPDALEPWSAPAVAVDDPVAHFIAAARAVQAEVHETAQWTDVLRSLVAPFAAIHVGPRIDPEALGRPSVDAATAAASPDTVVGVAWGTGGVAESGSVVVDDDGAHGPSLLTETSILLVPRQRIRARLEELPPAPCDVRARILVTGPSRTADIEKKIVLGAHGPRRLIVLIVGPS